LKENISKPLLAGREKGDFQNGTVDFGKILGTMPVPKVLQALAGDGGKVYWKPFKTV